MGTGSSAANAANAANAQQQQQIQQSVQQINNAYSSPNRQAQYQTVSAKSRKLSHRPSQ